MEDSLKFLGVTSSGLGIEIEKLANSKIQSVNDDELFSEASEIKDLSEKEKYLRKILESKSVGYSKSKRYLAELIKSKDLQFACDLLLSASRYSPIEPLNYILFAQIAIENQAWLVARTSLEASKWLTKEKDKESLISTEKSLDFVLEKINKKEKDASTNEFWSNKLLSKYWILERLYFQSDLEKFKEYAFKLISVFPNNMETYDVVYKAFTLSKDKDFFIRLAERIKENLASDKKNLNLYLGMCSYSLFDFDKSCGYLQDALKEDNKNPVALLYLALNYLVKADLKEFVRTYERIIPVREQIYIALHFISSAISNFNLGNKEFPNQKIVSQEVSLIVEKLLETGNLETVTLLLNNFKKLNYFSILPYLNLYLAELLIKSNYLEHAKELLSTSTDSEVHRLNAWIFRIEGKEDLAEKELMSYRKSWIPNKDAGLHCQTVALNLPDKSPKSQDEILEHVKSAYLQAKELIHKFDLEYGLNAMTCIETGCQDCCTKTFPYATYTEYLLIRKWLENQPEEFKNEIYEKSKQIVNLYKEKYNKEAPFLTDKTKNSKEEYPAEFRFNCPFLGENKCNVYEARPFTCRAYSYGSQDGVSYKGCDYFYEQIKGATKLHDVRKVLDMSSFTKFVKITDEELIGQNIIAPLPVWFSMSHEEILKKVKAEI